MSRIAIFDTSVFIDHLRTNRHQERIRDLTCLIRISAVVLSELYRGATERREIRFLHQLSNNHPILTPTKRNWLESGVILAKIRKEKGYLPEKLRALHFDVLIALTARDCGARVITSNRDDYELLKTFIDFELECW